MIQSSRFRPAFFKLVTPEEDLRFRYVDRRNIGVSKISSAAGSGDTRCEMSPEEFRKFYPPLIEWIRKMLDANAHVADRLLSQIFAAPPLFHQTHSGIDKSGHS